MNPVPLVTDTVTNGLYLFAINAMTTFIHLAMKNHGGIVRVSIQSSGVKEVGEITRDVNHENVWTKWKGCCRGSVGEW